MTILVFFIFFPGFGVYGVEDGKRLRVWHLERLQGWGLGLERVTRWLRDCELNEV